MISVARLRVGAATTLVLLAACSRRTSNGAPPALDAQPASSAEIPAPSAPSAAETIAFDMLEASPRCRIEHRGALIDLGTSEAAWSTPGHPDTASDLPAFERDGSTWGRVLDRAQTFTIALGSDVATGPALIAVRGRARAVNKATALIDGKAIGTLVFSPSEDKTVTVTASAQTIGPGLHTVTLRWHGAAKKEETLAELDWIRVGTVDDDPSAFAPPTRREAVAQTAIAGAPRKAYVLRAPSVVRCVTWVPMGAALMADVGALGDGGDGEVEARVSKDGVSPHVIAKAVATNRAWAGVSAPLGVDDAGGALVVVELAVKRAPKAGRIAIAEPRIVRAANGKPESVPPRSVDTAIVVVMSGLPASQLSNEAFAPILRETARFAKHRAPSALAGASVASLLTGLPVPVHALEDPGARLSSRTPLIGRGLTAFGVESAFFTEAPTTGPAFGFAHDWAHYAASSPAEGPPSAFGELDKFLAANVGKKIFIALHARGAHPPWEVAAEALKSLPPDKYSGPIDPKHSIPVLAKARRGLVRLAPADLERINALQDAALAPQLSQLAAVLDKLRADGRLDRTLFVLTGDVASILPPPSAPSTSKSNPANAAAAPSTSASATPSPTGERPPPREDPLLLPLAIRFPGGRFAGRVVRAVTDPTDVAATVLTAFGGSTTDLAGRNLADLAASDEASAFAPRLLDDGHGYVLSWADVRLSGFWGRAPQLLHEGATDDLRQSRPFEYLAAWGIAAQERARWLASRAKGPGREPATIDGKTAEALDSWERTR